MTIRSTLAFTFTAALAISTGGACTSSGDDDDNGDNGDTGDSGDNGDNGDNGDGDPGEDADPRSGTWGYAEYAANRNDCNLDADYGNGGGGFGLDNHGNGTFTVIPNDGTETFLCTLDGDSFDCPDRATEEMEVDGGYDALLIGQAVAEGIFSTDENGSGTQTATVSCEGSDCAIVEAALEVDFPCTLEVDFVIEWLGGI